MSVWTINGAVLPIRKLRRRLRSLAVDAVTFETGQNFDDAPLLALGSVCQVRKDGALWFTGVVTRNPAQGSGAAESQRYEVSGPWWYLEKLVFHQSWNIMTNTASGGGTPSYELVATPRTRVILGQDIAGGPLGVGDQIPGDTRLGHLAMRRAGRGGRHRPTHGHG